MSNPLNKNLGRRIGDDSNAAAERRQSLETRMDTLEAKLEENTELTKAVVDVFGSLAGGIKVLGWLGAAAKWAVSVGAFCTMIWAIAHGNTPSK